MEWSGVERNVGIYFESKRMECDKMGEDDMEWGRIEETGINRGAV